MKLISIIIPLYNADKFVEKAYSFILNQKGLKLPFEIIFVDNNSRDNSYELAKKITTKDSRVKVFKESKQGAPSARNRGFIESKGDLIYFFDVDDQLFDDSLASLSLVLMNHKQIDVVFGKLIKSSIGVENYDARELPKCSELIIREKPYWGLLWLKDLSKTIGPPGFLYRREVFEQVGMYNTKIPASEDTALDIEIGMKYCIAMIDRFVYLYYKHDQATTNILKKKKSRVFMQWPRIIHSHIPFYLDNKHEKEYHEILKQKIYSSIAKMIHETKGSNRRGELRKKLLNDIKPLQLPTVISLSIHLLVFIENKYFFKLYIYYVMPLFTKKVKLDKAPF